MARKARRPIVSTSLCVVGALLVGPLIGCNTKTTSTATTSPIPAETRSTDLNVYGTVPRFELTDQAGAEFDSRKLDGEIWLANFFFTTCPSTCPLQTKELARLQNVADVRLLSISVQPEVDTPDVLSKYAEQFGADSVRWSFLTGDRKVIWELSKTGFFLPVGDAPATDNMPIFHSSKVILVDGRRQIRGFYESQSPAEMIRLREDLIALIEQNKARPANAGEFSTSSELDELQGDVAGAFAPTDSSGETSGSDETESVDVHEEPANQ